MGTTAADTLAALGQRPTPASPGHGWLRSGRLLLLEQPSVQEELQFSKDQEEQVRQLVLKKGAVYRDRHLILDTEKWVARLAEVLARENSLLEGLGPEQVKRLKQIAWQESGASAFDDPEFAQALGLTEGQKEQIRAIQNAARQAMWAAPQPGRGPSLDWKKAEAAWRTARDQAVGLLTPEQKARWKELKGEPFKGEVRLSHPGAFGLRPGPPKRP